MEKTKRLIFLLSALLTCSVISGCGIDKEEYEVVVAELEQTKAELEQAYSKIAEIEKSLDLPNIDTDIMEKLRSAQQKAGDLSARVKSLTTENEQLKEELAKINTMK